MPSFSCVDHSTPASFTGSGAPARVDVHFPEVPEVAALKLLIAALHDEVRGFSARVAHLEGVVAIQSDLKLDVKIVPVDMPPVSVQVELPEWLKLPPPAARPVELVPELGTMKPHYIAFPWPLLFVSFLPFLYILGAFIYASLAPH